MEDIYIICTYGRQKEGGEHMSAKMGRPTSNPKTYKITVRLDEVSKNTLLSYCEKESVERAEAIRRGIGMLGESLKK